VEVVQAVEPVVRLADLADAEVEVVEAVVEVELVCPVVEDEPEVDQ